jgi:hypothetical protein
MTMQKDLIDLKIRKSRDIMIISAEKYQVIDIKTLSNIFLFTLPEIAIGYINKI